MFKIERLINPELQDEFEVGYSLSGANNKVKDVIELDGEKQELLYKTRKAYDGFNEKYNLTRTKNLNSIRKDSPIYWNLKEIDPREIKNKDYDSLLSLFSKLTKYYKNNEYREWNIDILSNNNIQELLKSLSKIQKKNLLTTIYGSSIEKLLKEKGNIDDSLSINNFVHLFNTISIYNNDIKTILNIVKNKPYGNNGDFEPYINSLKENGIIVLKGDYDDNHCFQYGTLPLHFQNYNTRIKKMQDLLNLKQDDIVKYFFDKKPHGKIYSIDVDLFHKMISEGLSYGTVYSANHILSLKEKNDDYNPYYSKEQIKEQIELIEDIIKKIKEIINYKININADSKVYLYETLFKFMKVDEEIKSHIKKRHINLD